MQTSLEVDTPVNQKVLSQSSIFPIEKLFTIAANDDDKVVIPSRYIKSKNSMITPTNYPLNRHTFTSDRIKRIRAMEEGEYKNLIVRLNKLSNIISDIKK